MSGAVRMAGPSSRRPGTAAALRQAVDAAVGRSVKLGAEAAAIQSRALTTCLDSRARARYARIDGMIDGEVAADVVRRDASVVAGATVRPRLAAVALPRDPLAVAVLVARSYDHVLTIEFQTAGNRPRRWGSGREASAQRLGQLRPPPLHACTTHRELLSVDVRDEGDRRVLVVHGELDLASAGQLEGALAGAAGHPLLLDLTDLRFLDARGFSAILSAAHAARDQGRAFSIRGAQGLVRRVFDILGAQVLFADGAAGPDGQGQRVAGDQPVSYADTADTADAAR